MSNILNIEIDRSERSIIRVLSIIERRGFEVQSLDCPPSSGVAQKLTVGLSSRHEGRAIQTLARQIERLQNVQRVETMNMQARKETRIATRTEQAERAAVMVPANNYAGASVA